MLLPWKINKIHTTGRINVVLQHKLHVVYISSYVDMNSYIKGKSLSIP